MKATVKKGVISLITFLAIAFLSIIVYVRFFLPDVGAAPYLKVDITPEKVERGKYLAHHVTVCMDCHSSRDWSRFSGPLLPETLGMGGEYFGTEMGFPGAFYAKNLTPTNLGEWTDGEIFRAITSGVNNHGKALFPVMPYNNYGKMDKEDIYDIIAYLRSLPALKDEVPDSKPDFPMSLILNTIPKEGEFQEKPDPSDKVRYGGYLVNAAGCIECHTQVKNGQVISDLAFSGGREFQMPNGVLRSSNITPDEKTGIGSWNEQVFINRFKAYSSPESVSAVKEGEFNSLMPWTMYAGMKTEDLRAIYAYLSSLEPINNKVISYSQNQ